jgi:hypothetical protein
MPIGFESMILTARGPWDGPHLPVPDERLIGAAGRLADTVVQHGRFGTRAEPDHNGHPGVRGVHVLRDDAGGLESMRAVSAEVDHGSGVVGFRPLEGVDHDRGRGDTLHYVAREASRVVGCARVHWDRIDARARILEVRAPDRAVTIALLSGTVEALAALAADGHLVVLVTVCADLVPDVDDTLTVAGFVPTAYFPRLVATADGRDDAVQYARVVGRSLRDSIVGVTAMAWPRARAVVERIIATEESSS